MNLNQSAEDEFFYDQWNDSFCKLVSFKTSLEFKDIRINLNFKYDLINV